MMSPFGTKATSSDPSGWPKDSCADSSLVLPLTQAPVSFKVCTNTTLSCEYDSDCAVGTCDVALYDYGSLAEFRTRVDNSMAGMMRDCAECHIGGSAHEFIIAAPGIDLREGPSIDPFNPQPRIPLRAFDDTALDSGKFNSYNYFIDQFDEDNDGIIGEVLPQNYNVTGVLEVDCFVCHLEGYDWEARKNAIRKGNFDISRAAGAGFLMPDGNVCSNDFSVTCTLVGDSSECPAPNICEQLDSGGQPIACVDHTDCLVGPDYFGPCLNVAGVCETQTGIISGTHGNYNSADDGSAPISEIVNIPLGLNGLYFSGEVLARIAEEPSGDNCSSCHFDEFQADWKKRGASWPSDAEFESLGPDGRLTEVHRYAGYSCVDCHSPVTANTNSPYEAGVDSSVVTDPQHDENLINERGGELLDSVITWTGIADDNLGHDVAKAEVPYGTLWNALDNTMYLCTTCHIDRIYPKFLKTKYVENVNGDPMPDPDKLNQDAGNGTIGVKSNNLNALAPIPPDPNAPGGAHEKYGLLYNYVQTDRDGGGNPGVVGPEGVFKGNASHIDIMACDVCHTRKFGDVRVDSETGLTYGKGGAMVDATASDDEGRLFDNESPYVQRLMDDNLVRAWQGDLLTIKHGLVTMFWRDADENFADPHDITKVDINADGQSGFMDPVKSIDVAAAMANYDDPANGVGLDPLPTLTHDGVITEAEIIRQRAALEQYLPTIGIDLKGNQQQLRLTFQGMLFRSNHGTSPKEYAWGHGGCLDCHQDGAGFYNGAYELKGEGLTLGWDNTGDQYVVPFTRVNQADLDGSGTVEEVPGDYQFTDFDPLLMPKGLTGRTLAIQVASGATDTLRDVDRSEFMYETDSTVDGAPGPRTMVSAAALGTRAEIVDHLNNAINITFPNFDLAMHQNFMTFAETCLVCHEDLIPPIEAPTGFTSRHHPTHMRIKEYDGSPTLTCTDCHESSGFGIKTTITVTNTWLDFVLGRDGDPNTEPDGTPKTDTFSPVPIMTQSGCNEWAVNPLHGTPGEPDYICTDPVDPVESGYHTCATACHPDVATPGTTSGTGFGEFSFAALSTLTDTGVDNAVQLDATRSSCDSGDCTVTISHSDGSPAVIGGNGDDRIVVQYAAEGNYSVSVTVTDNVNGGVDATASATAVAAVVEDAQSDGTVNVVNNGDGTCTVTYADDATTGIPVRAYIYWGDRTKTTVTDPATELIAPGITHSCGDTVRVELLDADHITTNLVF